MKPKDKLGRVIEVGSVIMYGHNLGRCAGLRVGIVKKIIVNDEARHIEDRWKFVVRGINDDWFYADPWDYTKLKLNEKDGTLSFVTRICVLNEVPNEHMQLLVNHFNTWYSRTNK